MGSWRDDNLFVAPARILSAREGWIYARATMPMLEDLQASSLLFYNHYRPTTASIQEVQMMNIATWTRYFVSSNFAVEMGALPADLTNFGLPAGLGTASATDAKVAAGKAPKSLVQLKGLSSDDNIIHAEQALLMMLAHRISGGAGAGTVTVAGRMSPCSVCREVLGAFSHAYDVVYGQRLFYNTATDGRDNHRKLEIKTLSLATFKTDNAYANTTFASFVTNYESYLTMNGKKRA
jgi:hypothetical protein